MQRKLGLSWKFGLSVQRKPGLSLQRKLGLSVQRKHVLVVIALEARFGFSLSLYMYMYTVARLLVQATRFVVGGWPLCTSYPPPSQALARTPPSGRGP